MCGIIGAITEEQVSPLLLAALRRLEYRGYDSAGVATLLNGEIHRRRAEGKLDNLGALLKRHPLEGRIGVGHTRWATHGVPNTINAHPHATRDVAIVHNGIIENFQPLRSELVSLGHSFETETDTEVVLGLLQQYLNQGMSPQNSTVEMLKRVEGAFALGIIFNGHDDLLIGARRGCPLAVGYGENAMFLGSDGLSLAPLTDRISYLEEGDWVEIYRDKVSIHNCDGELIDRPVRVSNLTAADFGKGNYKHFMLKEIYEQPAVIGECLHSLFNPVDRAVALPDIRVDFASVSRLSIVACGTSYYAGLIAKYWFEKFAKVG